eukprot:908372-Rhodomonas_salina.1
MIESAPARRRLSHILLVWMLLSLPASLPALASLARVSTGTVSEGAWGRGRCAWIRRSPFASTRLRSSRTLVGQRWPVCCSRCWWL